MMHLNAQTCDGFFIDQGSRMELMLLNGTHHLMNILLPAILLTTFLGRLILSLAVSPLACIFSWTFFTLTFCNGQVKCKIALQKELGLPVRPDCPVVSSCYLLGKILAHSFSYWPWLKLVDWIRWKTWLPERYWLDSPGNSRAYARRCSICKWFRELVS